jgi:hypothetical protein
MTAIPSDIARQAVVLVLCPVVTFIPLITIESGSAKQDVPGRAIPMKRMPPDGWGSDGFRSGNPVISIVESDVFVIRSMIESGPERTAAVDGDVGDWEQATTANASTAITDFITHLSADDGA